MRPARARAIAMVVIACFGAVVASASEPTAIEREARDIEVMVIAPCCFHQQVSVHQSPMATELKADIRARLAAGQGREAILAAYAQRWGTRVLAQPPRQGFGWTLYLMPPVGLLLTSGLLVAAMRRLAPRPAEVEASRSETSALREYDARIDDELADLS